MSITARIRQLERDRALIAIAPRSPFPCMRGLYITRSVHHELVDPQSALGVMGRQPYLLADLQYWVHGFLVTKDYLKPLDPPPNGVFEIRSTAPDPHVRVFGLFAAPNCFVGTGIRWRSSLGNKKAKGRKARKGGQWIAEMNAAVREWREMFGTPCFKGATIHDYVTEKCSTYPLPKAWDRG